MVLRLPGGRQSLERRERDPPRLREHPDPRRRAQREHERDGEPPFEPALGDGPGHQDRGAELDGAGQVVGRPHRQAAHLVGEELGEERAEAGGAAGSEAEQRHHRPEEPWAGRERLPAEREGRERAGREEGVDGVGDPAAEAVGDLAEGEHPRELPGLRGDDPGERLAHALVHLLEEEGRQPGVTGPVGAELEHAEDPREHHAPAHPGGEHPGERRVLLGACWAGAATIASRRRGARWRSIRSSPSASRRRAPRGSRRRRRARRPPARRPGGTPRRARGTRAPPPRPAWRDRWPTRRRRPGPRARARAGRPGRPAPGPATSEPSE